VTTGYPTAVEDYVKAVYGHTEWQQEPITTTQLAAKLGLAASSVTEMVKRLVVLGLVHHRPYAGISLTEEGTRLALRMVRRHRLIETWLVRRFGYGWDEVHDEAEILEHALSDRMLAAIDDELGHPVRDPHGDPIPSANGLRVTRPAAEGLARAAAGTTRIVRINDRDPALLRHLEASGLGIDAAIEVVGRAPFGGGFVVRVDGRDIDLGEAALQSIWVATVEPTARSGGEAAT
jgi:DtxR family Mn-dependent transcriptional regulator